MVRGFRWLISLALFLVAGTGARMLAAEKDPLPTPPPMARSQKISVYAGKPAEIQISVGGRIVEPLRFLIRTPPAGGTLGEIRRINRTTAVVTYMPPSVPGEDTFTFAAQSLDSPVSAPARVQIFVIEEPAKMEFAGELDFGNVFVGDVATRDLVLTNAGGEDATGKVEIAQPWAVKPPADFRVPGGETIRIPITFSPTDAREFAGRIVLGRKPTDAVVVSGAGVMPFEWRPVAVEVEPVRREEGEFLFQLKNLTADVREVTFEWPAGLKGPESVRISAGETAKLQVSVPPREPASIDSAFIFRSGGFRREIPVRVFPAPPRLETDLAAIDYGEIPVGRTVNSRLLLRNTGASDAQVKVAAPEGLILLPDPAGTIIQPGGSKEFELMFQGLTPGTYDQKLVFSYQTNGRLEIPVRASLVRREEVSPRFPGVLDRVEAVEPLAVPEATPLPTPVTGNPEKVIMEQQGLNEVVLSWVAGDAKDFRVEFRQISSDPGGRVVISWKSFPNVKIVRDGPLARATFEGLAAGFAWTIRVIGIRADGEEDPPSPAFQMTTKTPPPPVWKTWLLGLGLLAAAGGGIFLWRRYQRGQQTAHDRRISQLGKP